jgi:catalase (peroxidase I)
MNTNTCSNLLTNNQFFIDLHYLNDHYISNYRLKFDAEYEDIMDKYRSNELSMKDKCLEELKITQQYDITMKDKYFGELLVIHQHELTMKDKDIVMKDKDLDIEKIKLEAIRLTTNK